MKRFAILTGILSGFLFGVATPFSKVLLSDLNSFQLAGLLYLGAALAMLPQVIRKNSRIRQLFQKGNRAKTAGIIFFGGFAGPLLLLAGLKVANASSVSIWLNMELVATAIVGVLIFKDSLDRNSLIGVALTVLAGIIISLGEGSGGIVPALFILAACTCWAFDNHLTALTDGASPQSVTFVKGIMAGTVNLVIGILLSNHQMMSAAHVVPALVVGIFSYGFSILLYVTSAQAIGATRSQVLFSTAPVWGVLLAYLINHEPFMWIHVISMTFLAAAVLFTYRSSHAHTHTHEATEHIHYHRHDDGHHAHSHLSGTHPGKRWHSHLHTHDPETHTHGHYPDLHHRHPHD